jgi:hypothetical protein
MSETRVMSRPAGRTVEVNRSSMMRRGGGVGVVTGMRRLGSRVLVVACALLALPVVAAAAAHAVPVPQFLSLDPADGPQGTTVTRVADGFGDCPPVDDADPVRVVAVEWDGTDELGRASVSDDGSASSTFIVPESASLDAHRVFATCLGDAAMTEDEVFTVTPTDMVPVAVPNVVGMTEDRHGRSWNRKTSRWGRGPGTGTRCRHGYPAPEPWWIRARR